MAMNLLVYDTQGFFILLCVELAYKHVERAEGW